MNRLFGAVSLLAIGLSGSAAAKCHHHKSKKSTEVCIPTWWGGGYSVVKVAAKTATSILAYVPGSQLASEWSPDADGDSYGSATAAMRKCPAPGYVDNSSDCNDNAAGIHPDAAEICGDGIDQNCNVTADEGCQNEVVCPCFTGDELDSLHAAWQAGGWAYSTATCTDQVVPASYTSTQIAWYGERYGNASANETTTYYSIDYDESGRAYCSRFHRRNDYDATLGVWNESDFEDTFTAITADQDAACRDVIYDFAERAGLVCE